MHSHSILISDIAPEDSICDICGNSAPWQMYCKDCGHILSFYCDDHAYLSQGDSKLEKHVKRAYRGIEPLRMEQQINKAKDEWQSFLNRK
jgi:predicted amidophosphoribosyltransferase